MREVEFWLNGIYYKENLNVFNIFFEDYFKIDYTKIITKQLNLNSNVNKIESNVHILEQKSKITNEELKIIMGNRKIIDKSLNIKKEELIKIMGWIFRI